MHFIPKPDPSDPNWDSSPRQIPLTRGLFATVDASDFEWLSQWKWFAKPNKSGLVYAGRRRRLGDETSGAPVILMHRAILGCEFFPDHKDGNGLNNQRQNLRESSRIQNHFNSKPQRNNTSGFKGVSWDGGGWIATLWFNRIRFSSGRFKDINDAVVAYAIFSLVFHGEFSFLHRPQTKPPFELLT